MNALPSNIPIGCYNECDDAKVVLMHDPNDELFFGVLHPSAALFEGYLDFRKANFEHKSYQKILSSNGIQVCTIRKVLLEGTVDPNDPFTVLNNENTKNLREFSKSFLTFESCDSSVSQSDQDKYRDEIISKAHPFDLLNIILKSPVIKLRSTTNNTLLAADYLLNPLFNLFFTRDQCITTSKGVILGRMNSPQRERETRIIDFCLRKMGIIPILAIADKDAFLEGGDFIPFGDISFIGCGMRTNLKAIEQMMEADVFGTETVCVVNDRRRYQPQMHLDTYFNIIDKDLCIFSEERLNSTSDTNLFAFADLYERNKQTGKYSLKSKDVPFTKYLTEELKMTIIPISVSDSNTYACNFLTIGPRKIVAVAGQSKNCKSTFAKHKVTVYWADIKNCTLGYGAAHCMTQVLSRRAEK